MGWYYGEHPWPCPYSLGIPFYLTQFSSSSLFEPLIRRSHVQDSSMIVILMKQDHAKNFFAIMYIHKVKENKRPCIDIKKNYKNPKNFMKTKENSDTREKQKQKGFEFISG